jgi:hypothetical protein
LQVLFSFFLSFWLMFGSGISVTKRVVIFVWMCLDSVFQPQFAAIIFWIKLSGGVIECGWELYASNGS